MKLSSFNNITLSSLSQTNEKAVVMLPPQAKKIGTIALAIFVTCLAVYGLYRLIFFKGRQLGQEADKLKEGQLEQETDKLKGGQLGQETDAFKGSQLGQEADKLRKDWKLEEAAKKFQEALKHDPVDTFNLIRYTKTLKALGKSDEALQHIAKAVEQRKKAAESHPKDSQILSEYAQILMCEFYLKSDFKSKGTDNTKLEVVITQKTELKNVEQAINEVIKIDSKNVVCLLLKGRVTAMLSHHELEEKSLSGPMPKESEYDAYADKWAEEVKKVFEIAPQDPRVLKAYASRLEFSKNFDEARKQYEAILKINPEHVYAHYRLGALSAEKGDFEGAVKHYLACLKIRPSYLRATKDCIIVLKRLKKPEEVIEQYEKALEIRPTDCELLWAYAGFLEELKRPAAIEQYKKLFKLTDVDDSGKKQFFFDKIRSLNGQLKILKNQDG